MTGYWFWDLYTMGAGWSRNPAYNQLRTLTGGSAGPGGGSQYTGGVENGTSQTGVRSGNGYAKITLLSPLNAGGDIVPSAIQDDNVAFSEVTWENGKASVTISTPTNYILEYQVNGTEEGNWARQGEAGKDITAIGLSHGDIVYARLTDGVNSGNYISTTIQDTVAPTAPEITGGTAEYTSSKIISVSVNAVDNESGIAYYQYYVANDNTVPDETTPATGNVGSTPEEKEKEFDTNYDGAYVYFRAVDKARNVGPWSEEPQRLYINTSLLTDGSKEFVGEEPFTFKVPANVNVILVEGRILTKTLEIGDEMIASETKTWLTGQDKLTKDDFEEWNADEDAYILYGHSYVKVTPGKTYTITPTNSETTKITWSKVINYEAPDIEDL